MQQPSVFDGKRVLREAIAVILGDRQWWLKVGIGGLLMITLLGAILPQGFMIEHLDNSRRGFRTPMPLWRQWSDKGIMGMLASMFDVFYFVMPIVGGLLLLVCGLAPLIVSPANTSSPWLLWMFLFTATVVMGISFALSLSPLAKVGFSKDGDLEQGLGRRALDRSLNALNRSLYLRTRLFSSVAYLPALLAGVLFWQLIGQTGVNTLLILFSAWLLASSLFWAWLVVAQMYLAASLIAEDRQIEARIAARRAGLE